MSALCFVIYFSQIAVVVLVVKKRGKLLETVAESAADKLDACGWVCADPYGVAQFDLSDLLLGQTALELRAPIMNSHVAEPTKKPSVGIDGRLIPPPGVREGPSTYFPVHHLLIVLVE